MGFKRRVGDRMCSVLLLFGNVLAAQALTGINDTPYQNLVCTNDIIEWMFCNFEAQNCSQYNLTIWTKYKDEPANCIPKQCDDGQCCCSTKIMLIYDATYTAKVWKRGETVGSENISITDGIKPRVPTITSVTETNGNFQVRWKSNMEYSEFIDKSLEANVTWGKKEDTEKISEFVRPTTVEGLKLYEILGRLLEPSTTYVVCVKSYLKYSRRFSDCSNEYEFTTGSPDVIPLVTIISLSVAAVIISGAIYGCYVWSKEKWWDPVAKWSNPKLLDMHPSKREIFKPVHPVISSVCVEPLMSEDSKPWLKSSLRDISDGSPQHSSGISTGSSRVIFANTEPFDIIAGVQDALGKAFALSPISPLTTSPLKELNKDCGFFPPSSDFCGVRSDDSWIGSSCFDNNTYSILIPSLPVQIMSDGSEVQLQAEMPSDPVYHPSEGGIVIGADPKLTACPLIISRPEVSSVMATDMSYQQCNAESVQFSCAEDSSVSSITDGSSTTASCDPVFRVEAGCECTHGVFGGAARLNVQMEKAAVCDDNPCYGGLPAASPSFPPVDDDYQAFQSLVEQCDNEHLNKCPEKPCTKMSESFFCSVIPSFTHNIQGRSESVSLQRPLISADRFMPVITDSGYQRV